MTPTNFDPSMVIAILPAICLLCLAGLVLIVDLVVQPQQHRSLGWLTAIGLLIIGIISLVFSRPGDQPTLILGGMLRQDWLSFVFLLVFLFGAAITALFAMDSELIGQRGEFYVLLLVATLGMSLMASSADLIMLYLAIETTSIPLYVLAGFLFRDKKSTEAGIKYLLFGALTSAVMLYGFSLLYGFSGTPKIYLLAQKLQAGNLPPFVIIGTAILLLFGFLPDAIRALYMRPL